MGRGEEDEERIALATTLVSDTVSISADAFSRALPALGAALTYPVWWSAPYLARPDFERFLIISYPRGGTQEQLEYFPTARALLAAACDYVKKNRQIAGFYDLLPSLNSGPIELILRAELPTLTDQPAVSAEFFRARVATLLGVYTGTDERGRTAATLAREARLLLFLNTSSKPRTKYFISYTKEQLPRLTSELTCLLYNGTGSKATALHDLWQPTGPLPLTFTVAKSLAPIPTRNPGEVSISYYSAQHHLRRDEPGFECRTCIASANRR